MSGDRYAWKGMVYTQELVNYLKTAKQELQDLFAKGAFCGETIDTTAMTHVEIIGRCKLIDAVLEAVDEGIPSGEEEEDLKIDNPAKDYKDA
mgnify:CR=1 FL=1|jgi:hypothetical protein|tara:strand:- start:830 stop:1105 length:276 start_codon:yes stop_codon:yes gene_type:complete